MKYYQLTDRLAVKGAHRVSEFTIHPLNLALRAGQDRTNQQQSLAASIADLGYRDDSTIVFVMVDDKPAIISGAGRYNALRVLCAKDPMWMDFCPPQKKMKYESESELIRAINEYNPVDTGATVLQVPMYLRVQQALKTLPGVDFAKTPAYTGTQVLSACGILSTNGSMREFLRGFMSLCSYCNVVTLAAEMVNVSGEVRKYLTGTVSKDYEGGILQRMEAAAKNGNTELVKQLKIEFIESAKSFWTLQLSGRTKAKTTAQKIEEGITAARTAAVLNAASEVEKHILSGDGLTTEQRHTLDMILKLTPAERKEINAGIYRLRPDLQPKKELEPTQK